jgi:hypothetical protein
MTERIVLLREPVEADGVEADGPSSVVTPRRYEATYFRTRDRSAVRKVTELKRGRRN